MEAEEQKKSSETEHRCKAEDFTIAERRVSELEKRLSREIEKSRPYFELKDQLNADLQSVKTEIENLQEAIGKAKATYAQSLKRLESISEEIHERRNNGSSASSRTPGVGAETPTSTSASSLSSFCSSSNHLHGSGDST